MGRVSIIISRKVDSSYLMLCQHLINNFLFFEYIYFILIFFSDACSLSGTLSSTWLIFAQLPNSLRSFKSLLWSLLDLGRVVLTGLLICWQLGLVYLGHRVIRRGGGTKRQPRDLKWRRLWWAMFIWNLTSHNTMMRLWNKVIKKLC